MPGGYRGGMLPLAVSGTLVIGVAVVLAVALLLYLLKRENEDEARDRAESDR
jgi:hypothetical protein